MISNRQFHIFHDGNNLSSDQRVAIADAVEKRQHILEEALKKLQQATDSMGSKVTYKPKPVRQKFVQKAPAKRADTTVTVQAEPQQKALKGKVSYKVKGPGGKLMNLAEVKNWVNSIYDGEQGIVKQ